jgi:hypothetical protein
MAERNASFEGTIPELYDRHLGPVIFAPYAADLARRVAMAGRQSYLRNRLRHGYPHAALTSVSAFLYSYRGNRPERADARLCPHEVK